MGVLWLEEPRFEEAFSKAFPDEKLRFRHTVDDRFQMQVSAKEIELLVPTASDSRGDPSDPGPVDRWYGVIEGSEPFFFVLAYHHGLGNAIVAAPPSNSKIGPFRWSPLRKLAELPRPMAQRVSWIWGHGSAATHALFYRDSTGNVTEAYRATSVAELEALQLYLKEQQHEIEFFVSTPTPFKPNWSVYRPEQKRGWSPVEKHPDFMTCAARAKELSRDGTLYCVAELPKDYFSVDTLGFRNGVVETF